MNQNDFITNTLETVTTNSSLTDFNRSKRTMIVTFENWVNRSGHVNKTFDRLVRDFCENVVPNRVIIDGSTFNYFIGRCIPSNTARCGFERDFPAKNT